MAELLDKAQAAARSAKLLFDAADYDGCVNRAYYAMFDAARGYLKVCHALSTAKIKTHAGTLSAFSELGVKQGGLNPELGRALNRAMVRRNTADYGDMGVEREAAERTLDDMSAFLKTVSKLIEESRP